MRHLISLRDLTRAQVDGLMQLASQVKQAPEEFQNAMDRKILIMIFEKPSLRTRVSFEAAMCQMGGHAIYYDVSDSPLAAGKENIHDTVKVLGRYANMIMARLFKHEDIEEMVRYSKIPVINGLTNFSHPCQILSDLLTIREKKGELAGLTLAYLGDANNNVTHSLMYGCAVMGMNIRVGCPDDPEYSPTANVMAEAGTLARAAGGSQLVTHDPIEAARGADVVYTDSWMSYHIPAEELEKRVRMLRPYQVNVALMAHAKPDAIFMNCLPAQRDYEQTAEIIDGPQSVVFDQAENRLHMEKAVLIELMRDEY